MGGRQPKNAIVARLRAVARPRGEDLRDAQKVWALRQVGQREERLDGRCKGNEARVAIVIKRAKAVMVAGEEQLARARVPQRKGPVADEALNAVAAPTEVRPKDEFVVGDFSAAPVYDEI